MDILITTLHVLVCICLIAIVLLQQGKGADMGVALGGGASNTVFGARGAGNFLTKLTTGAAIVFMLTSVTLSRMGGDSGVEDILRSAPVEIPAEEALPESTVPQAETLEEGTPSGFEAIEPPGFEEIEPVPEAPAEP